jgi:hypothetical protein
MRLQASVITDLEIYQKMDALFDSKEKWSKGAAARNINGRPVPSLSSEAISFCLIGAMDHIVEKETGSFNHFADRYYEKMKPRIKEALGIGSVAMWNDDPRRTFTEIKDFIRDMINYEREHGQDNGKAAVGSD